MFLQLPNLTEHNRNLHSIISPRSHHAQTLENIQYLHHQSFYTHAKKRIQSHQTQYQNYKIPQKMTQKLIQNNTNNINQPFQLLYNSKSHHLTHSRSLSVQTPQNKFYSFKRIREHKFKQQNFEEKVIKSFKINPQNQKLIRKKVIQHLDEVTTIESKNSPRQSLNSLTSPQIQESVIIMKGGDLYNDLMKQNNVENSKYFEKIKMQTSIFQTPEIRKELCESNYWSNQQNKPHYNEHCFTDPRKYIPFDENESCQQKTNIHSFLRHLNPLNIQRNNLSFLKAKRFDKKY